MVSLGTQPANRKSGFGHSSPTGARAQDLSRQPARPDLWGAGVGNDPGLPDRARARRRREQVVKTWNTRSWSLPTTRANAHGFPGGDRIRGQPHGDITSLDQRSVVCRPVPDVVFRLVLRVHSRLHVEIMRLPSLRWPGGRARLTEGAGSVHQRRALVSELQIRDTSGFGEMIRGTCSGD